MSKVQMRAWQVTASDKRSDSREAGRKTFVVEACPAAGKTRFAMMEAKRELDRGACDFVIVVVPTKNIASGFIETAADLGIRANDIIYKDRPVSDQYRVKVVTYQYFTNRQQDEYFQIMNRGKRMMLILDEVHHCGDALSWGDAVADVVRRAECVLALSGTLFRTDGRQIAAIGDVHEDDHEKYTYAEGINQGVCRPMKILHDNTKWSASNGQMELSGFAGDDDSNGVKNRALFNPKTDWLECKIAEIDDILNDMRKDDPRAACLVVAGAGMDEDRDQKKVREVASKVSVITGSDCHVATCCEKTAQQTINRFRDSSDKYLASVRMVSEGVDIPRIRIVLLHSPCQSELLYRQIAGRAMRSGDIEMEGRIRRRHGAGAVLVHVGTREMSEFAKRLEDEVEVATREIERREAAERERGENSDDYAEFEVTAAPGEGTTVVSGVEHAIDDCEIRRRQEINGCSYEDARRIEEILRENSPAEKVVDDRARIKAEEFQKKRLRAECNSMVQKYFFSGTGKRYYDKVGHINNELNKKQRVKSVPAMFEEYGVEKFEERKRLIQRLPGYGGQV